MKRFKPWLLLALVFVSGLASGVVGTRIVVRHYVDRAIVRPDWVRERIEGRLAFRLGLDTDQRAQMREVLAEAHKELRSVRAEFQPRLREITANAESKIAATLTPRQRDKFEKLKRENRLLWPRP